MRTISFSLTEEERKFIEVIASNTKLTEKEKKKVQSILALGQGKQQKTVAEELKVSSPTLKKWLKLYKELGTDFFFLKDKKIPGRPKEIDGITEAKITALACSPAPEGYAKWSIRLLADKAVELDLVENISRMSVQRFLKKMNLSLT